MNSSGRWTFLSVATAALCVMTLAVRAQNNPPRAAAGRLACIDVVRIFNEFQRQKDLAEEMKQMQDSLQKQNASRREKIDQFQNQLDAMDPNDPAYMQKTRDMLAMQIDYKNWFDLKQADISREVGIWTARIYKEICGAAGAVAQRSDVDMILYKDEFEPPGLDPQQVRDQIRSRKLIYANPASDITQGVLDELNAVYRSQPRKPMLVP